MAHIDTSDYRIGFEDGIKSSKIKWKKVEKHRPQHRQKSFSLGK